jgi:hypothetical protein
VVKPSDGTAPPLRAPTMPASELAARVHMLYIAPIFHSIFEGLMCGTHLAIALSSPATRLILQFDISLSGKRGQTVSDFNFSTLPSCAPRMAPLQN